MATLKVVREDAGRGIVVLRLRGPIDSHTYRTFAAEIERAIVPDTVGLVVDMSGVDYVSSAGAGALIGAYTRLESRQGGMVLAGVQAAVEDTFRVLGLTQLFVFAAGASDAARLLGEATGAIPA